MAVKEKGIQNNEGRTNIGKKKSRFEVKWRSKESTQLLWVWIAEKIVSLPPYWKNREGERC